MALFADRSAAGQALGRLLAAAYAGREDVVVLGLPRGGVRVAAEVASVLVAPLDVLVVRKLGAPGQPELAMGAIASGGARVVDRAIVDRLRVSPAALEAIAAREAAELARRETAYRGPRPPLRLHGRTALLVDDGIATGASVRVAAIAVRAAGPAAVVAAAPCGPADAVARLADVCDDVVLAASPPAFRSVGSCYDDFAPTSDAEVRAALAGA